MLKFWHNFIMSALDTNGEDVALKLQPQSTTENDKNDQLKFLNYICKQL